MIVVLAELKIKENCVERWQGLIAAHAERCIALEPGCRQFDASVDPANPSQWMLYEVYTGREALIQHRQMPHFELFFGPSKELVETRVVREFSWRTGGSKKV